MFTKILLVNFVNHCTEVFLLFRKKMVDSLVRDSTAPIKRDHTSTGKTYILDLFDNKIKSIDC